MGVYRKLSCPKCKYVIENWGIAYQVAGQPYMNCPNCEANLDLRSYVKEWFLLNTWSKIGWILRSLYTSVFYMLPATVILYVVIDYFNEQLAREINWGFAWFLLIGIIILFILSMYWDISQSIKRLSDKEYVKILIDRGFTSEEKMNKVLSKYKISF